MFSFIIPAITAAAAFFRRHPKETIDAAGHVLGGLAGGRAKGRFLQGEQQLSQDALRARMYDTVTRNMLDRYGMDTRNQLGLYGQNSQNIFNRAALGAQLAKFQLDAPSTRFDQALRGGLAANMQDVTANVPGRYAGSKVTFSGGLRPSAIGPEGRTAGQRLSQLALERMGKDSFDVPDVPAPPMFGAPPTLPAPPDLQGLPQSNWLDKLLSIGAPASAFIGGLTHPNPGSPPTNVEGRPTGSGPWGDLLDPNAGFGQEPPVSHALDIDPAVLFRNLRRQNFGSEY